MKIDIETVQKMAHLARIDFSAAELQELKGDLGQILTWMEKLQEINTEQVDPLLNMSEEVTRWRSDKIESHLEKGKVIENAPESDGSFFLVPKVVNKM